MINKFKFYFYSPKYLKILIIAKNKNNKKCRDLRFQYSIFMEMVLTVCDIVPNIHNLWSLELPRC
jgi:hypothetical protein